MGSYTVAFSILNMIGGKPGITFSGERDVEGERKALLALIGKWPKSAWARIARKQLAVLAPAGKQQNPAHDI